MARCPKSLLWCGITAFVTVAGGGCSPSNTGDGGACNVTCPAGYHVSSDCTQCEPLGRSSGGGNSSSTGEGATSSGGGGGSTTSGANVSTTSGSGSSSGSTAGGSSGSTGGAAVGGACAVSSDCSSDYCNGGVCACNTSNPSAPLPCQVPTDCCTGVMCRSGHCVAASSSGGSSGASFPVAAHNPFGTIPYNGGPTIANPSIVTITFQGDQWATNDQAWAQWVVGSNWLAEVGQDYGIGAGSYAGNVSLAAAGSLSDDSESPYVIPQTTGDLRATLEGLFANGTLPAPTARSGTIYMFFIPQSTSFTLFGSPSCTAAAGYHYWYEHGGSIPVTYAAMFDCGATLTGRPDPEEIEVDASHEFMEAATDSLPNVGLGGQPGWSINSISDPSEIFNPWAAFGAEVGDLCQVTTTEYLDPVSGFYAQRIWSNTAAQAATTSPCVPIPPGELFYSMSGETLTVLASPGFSINFYLTGWSTAPSSDWCVEAVPDGLGGGFAPSGGPITGTSNNGQPWTLQLSVPADAGPPPPDDAGNVPISLGAEWVASTDCNGNVISVWPLQLAIPPVGRSCTPPTGIAVDPCAQYGLQCTSTGAGSSCQLPGEYSACGPTVGCESAMPCTAVVEDGGTADYCVEPCQQTTDCADSTASCQSLQGQDLCLPDTCGPGMGNGNGYFVVCNNAGTSDGTCIPVQTSTGGVEGLCLAGGTIPVDSACEPGRTSGVGLCHPGEFCVGGSSSGYACMALCSTGTSAPGGGPNCAAGSDCIPYGDGFSFGVCAVDCTSSAGACPSGFSCVSYTSTESICLP